MIQGERDRGRDKRGRVRTDFMKIKNTGNNGKGRRKIVRSNDKDEKKVEEVRRRRRRRR